MKNIYLVRIIIFTFIVSGALWSCNSRKIGFFHNNDPQYSVKNKNTHANPSETTVASTLSDKSNTGKLMIPAEIQNEAVQLSKEISKDSPNLILNQNLTDTAEKVSKKERKEVKKFVKENLKSNKASDDRTNTLLLVIIAILLPPLAVALVDGITGPFWLSLLLTLIFYVPGLIYALYRIFREE